MIHVVLVDDHDIVREGLRSVLSRTEDMRLIADYADGDEFLENAASLPRIDVVVLDIAMSRTSGIDVLTSLKEEFTDPPPVVFLTVHPEEQRAKEVMQLGARGYITKSAPHETVCEAIRIVASGGIYLSEDGRRSVLGDSAPELQHDLEKSVETKLATLSKQENRVFRMLCAGMTQKEIAFEMDISERTVSTYKHRVMKKLDAKSTVDLVRIEISLSR